MMGNLLPAPWPPYRRRCRLYARRGGFTLIELMLVLVLVGLLAGLLLPALGRAGRKVKGIHCRSQMRQWSLALWLHGDDAQGRFPYEGTFMRPINRKPNEHAWYNQLPRYVGMDPLASLYQARRIPMPGQRSLFVCPQPNAPLQRTPSMSRPYFMYGFNNRMDPNGPGRFRRAQLCDPSRTVVFTENSERHFPSTSGRYTPARHQGRANLAFGDGHVEPVPLDQYFRTAREDRDSRLEWARAREVYWYPFAGAPR